MTPNEFVDKAYKWAIKAGKKYGLNPFVILSQAATESGWGSSTLSKQYNNYFGITAGGKTNEFWDGDYYISKSSGLKFRVYEDEQDSFNDFARLIKERYDKAYAVSSNLKDYANKIANSAYISEDNGDNRSQYEKLLLGTFEKIEKAAKDMNVYNQLLKYKNSPWVKLGIVVVSLALLFIGYKIVKSIW